MPGRWTAGAAKPACRTGNFVTPVGFVRKMNAARPSAWVVGRHSLSGFMRQKQMAVGISDIWVCKSKGENR
jgi:hypothetical protein